MRLTSSRGAAAGAALGLVIMLSSLGGCKDRGGQVNERAGAGAKGGEGSAEGAPAPAANPPATPSAAAPAANDPKLLALTKSNFAWEQKDLPECFGARNGAKIFVWRLQKEVICNTTAGQWQ